MFVLHITVISSYRITGTSAIQNTHNKYHLPVTELFAFTEVVKQFHIHISKPKES
jgi:hypothetical protein